MPEPGVHSGQERSLGLEVKEPGGYPRMRTRHVPPPPEPAALRRRGHRPVSDGAHRACRVGRSRPRLEARRAARRPRRPCRSKSIGAAQIWAASSGPAISVLSGPTIPLDQKRQQAGRQAGRQALWAARLIVLNIRLTLSSHSAPNVVFATLPISEKLAAGAKSRYLLSSFWFAPAPGEPRPEGRRAPAHHVRHARRPMATSVNARIHVWPRIRAFALTTR